MLDQAGLDDLRARIPRLDCKGLCAASCGPVPVNLPELVLIEAAVGPVPHQVGLLRGEPTAVMQTTRKKKTVRTPEGRQHVHELRCVQLRNGRCTIYEHRPLICRLWGVVDSPRMRCPFGCVPERWLTDAECQELLARSDDATTGRDPPERFRDV